MKFGDKPDIDRAVALIEQMDPLDNVGGVGKAAWVTSCSTPPRARETTSPSPSPCTWPASGTSSPASGTLADTTAVHAAQAFYRTLGDTTSADGAAAAVRAVTHELWDKHPHRPDLWAALIHSGP